MDKNESGGNSWECESARAVRYDAFWGYLSGYLTLTPSTRWTGGRATDCVQKKIPELGHRSTRSKRTRPQRLTRTRSPYRRGSAKGHFIIIIPLKTLIKEAILDGVMVHVYENTEVLTPNP